jgi:hypothetical protein
MSFVSQSAETLWRFFDCSIKDKKYGSSELAGEDLDNKMAEMLAGQRIEISMRYPNDHFINFCYDLVIERLSAISYMVSSVEPKILYKGYKNMF